MQTSTNITKKLVDATSYLISLYYKTDCQYSCTRPKINRLLTIYVLCNVKKTPITHKIFCITSDYIGLKVLPRVIPISSIYQRLEYKDNQKEILLPLKEKVEIPPYYQRMIDEITSLDDSDKELLEQIFRKFGSYDIISLAPNIDKLKNIIPFEIDWNYGANLDTNTFINFLKENKNKYLDNDVLNFIKIHHGIYPFKIKKIFKNQIQNNKQKQKEQLKKYKITLKYFKEKRPDELTDLLEIINELVNLENNSLKEVKDNIIKKRSLKK